MSDVFADTFYFLARLSETDAAHERAIEISRSIIGRVVTTAWVLTDCISFIVMEDMNLRDALTGDKHFEQAGFVALLK